MRRPPCSFRGFSPRYFAGVKTSFLFTTTPSSFALRSFSSKPSLDNKAPSAAMSRPPRIAIVGGGPAGLTLGVLLHKQGIEFNIYEYRQKPTAEELAKPSGMLDLHEESGLAAIRTCGLWDQFLPLTKDCTDSMRIIDKHDNILYQDYGELVYRPEISRHALLNLLMSALPADRIQWGSKLVNCTTNSGRVTLDFGGGTEPLSYDLVIGADGAWSKVRPLLTTVKPYFTGLNYTTLTITKVITRYPQIADLLGDGSAFALGDCNGISSHRAAQDSVRLYVITSSDKEISEWVGKRPTELKGRLLGEGGPFGSWGPKLKECISIGCDEEEATNPGPADVRSFHMLPVGHRWKSHPAVTLVGDASHLMTPFAGEGVNLAMWDSLELSEAIAKAHRAEGASSDHCIFREVLAPLLGAFDNDMFSRAEEKAKETLQNRQLLFSENGAHGMVDLMQSFMPRSE